MSEQKQKSTLEKILEVLERIDCRLDSIESAAVQTCEDEDTAPELQDDPVFEGTQTRGPLHAVSHDPEGAKTHPPVAIVGRELTYLPANPSATQTQFMCFCARMITFNVEGPKPTRNVTCECGNTWRWYSEGQAPPIDTVGRRKKGCVAQWQRDRCEFLDELDPEDYGSFHSDVTALLSRAYRMLLRQEREINRLELDAIADQESGGLQPPPRHSPADGAWFIIQYLEGERTIVEAAFYDREEKWFVAGEDTVARGRVDVMMPFPEAVKVDRSGK